MPITDTNIQKVIVNKLTQAQYNSATKNPNEFYAVTDADNSEIEVVNVAANIHGTGTIIGTDWTEDDPYYTGTKNRASVQNLSVDKTYAEILALINAGKKVYAKVNLAAFTASGSGGFPWIAFPGDYYVELTINDTTDSGIVGSIKVENIAETTTLSVLIIFENGSTSAQLTLDSDFLWSWGLYNATNSALDARVYSHQGAPTTSSAGEKGTLWEDTTNGKLYLCTAKTAQGTTPETYTYTWEEITPNGLQFKTLTAADVNFPVDNPSMVSLWRLPTGVYTSASNSVTMTLDDYTGGYYNAAYKLTPGKYAVVIHNPADANVNVYIYSSNEGIASGTVLNNTGSSPNKAIGPSKLANNLTTTNEYAALGAAQGRILNQKIEGRVMTGSGAPTTSTVGTVGGLYEDTTNGNVYICTTVSGGVYTWERLAKVSELPNFTMTTTDPGEGQPLAANNFIAVYAA